MMYRTIADFYTSKEWRSFREQLIHERTKPDGMVYDEYDGKPLLKRYDIIAHHKQELTLQNVNDVEISLNPANIMLVSMRSHNEIHARFGHSQGKKVYYVYGAPCAGKSRYVNSVKGNSDLIVDIDNIWEALTGRKYFKPDALKVCVFELYNKALDIVKTRQGRWQRAYVVTGGASKGQRDRDISSLGAEPIFVDATKDECINNLMSDGTKDVVLWREYIDAWFDRYQA